VAKKRKRSARNSAAKKTPAATPDPPLVMPDDSQIQYSGLSLHELFAQQTMAMLDRSDLDEEQKQNILVAMACPCCGAGGPSFTVKLKRRS
jgi:hypothetical protein